MVETHHRGEATLGDIRCVRRGDERVRVGRVAHNKHPNIVSRAGVDRLALGLEDPAIGREKITALHACGAGAGTDEQCDVDTVEGRTGVISDVDAGKQREGTVVELHRGALGRLERRGDLEHAQSHGHIGAEQMT
ncbi:unannotated protein [freshwater metagenome]|uniref:Unannotated protein n=1 Tax=freshwater metagenome TaxID=449393 RepID=A0A6J7BZQ3_9ZZZZ